MGDGDMVVPVKGDILCSVNSVLFLQGPGPGSFVSSGPALPQSGYRFVDILMCRYNQDVYVDM